MELELFSVGFKEPPAVPRTLISLICFAGLCIINYLLLRLCYFFETFLLNLNRFGELVKALPSCVSDYG